MPSRQQVACFLVAGATVTVVILNYDLKTYNITFAILIIFRYTVP